MMDKFNFYDIYGYLLPGFTLLALICLPFGLNEGHWPTAELSSALFAIIFAYIIGHILQALARNAFPPKVIDDNGNLRYPSDLVLDKKDKSLSSELKKGLADCIQKSFTIDVGIESETTVIIPTFTERLTNWLTHNEEADKPFPAEWKQTLAECLLPKEKEGDEAAANPKTLNERLAKGIREDNKFLSPQLKQSLNECISKSLKTEFKIPTFTERFKTWTTRLKNRIKFFLKRMIEFGKWMKWFVNRKNRIKNWIKMFFGINSPDNFSDKPQNSFESKRRDAFFLCRDVLIKAKSVSYAEQSQGMYALMMGLGAAFALAAAYHLGWSISGLRRETFEAFLKAILLIALGVDLFIALLMLKLPDLGRATRARVMTIFLAVALFASGYLWGLPQWASPDQRMRLFAIALFGVFSSSACFAAEKYFAHEFAVAVYRAFYTHQKSKEAPELPPEENLDCEGFWSSSPPSRGARR